MPETTLKVFLKVEESRLNIRNSIFIGRVFPVDNDHEAREIVKRLKTEDRKADHIAFAFRIGENPVSEGMSDSGEPRGTAGLPILSLMRHKKITGFLVTVTRYFGGTKLGPGNLKRAYAEAAGKALGI